MSFYSSCHFTAVGCVLLAADMVNGCASVHAGNKALQPKNPDHAKGQRATLALR